MQQVKSIYLLQVETIELDLTVLLNLKCEELWEIGTPIMAQTKVIFKFRELSKGVEFNSVILYRMHMNLNLWHYLLFLFQH